jgi:hypothetical protein
VLRPLKIFGPTVGLVVLALMIASEVRSRRDTLAEFSSALDQRALQIDLVAHPGCSKFWRVPLTGNLRAEFIDASRRAQSGRTTSHCETIHEAKVELITPSRRITYYSTVCKQEPDALILTKVEEGKDKNRVSYFGGIRLESFGPWIRRVAPSGAL